MLPLAILHILRFTHRFAGPIVRLRRSMRELAAGEAPPRLKFRDLDYWQELADDYNSLADALTEARARIVELEMSKGELTRSTANGIEETEIEPVVAI
ncbi:MAG: hypothetical protein ACR2NU_07250, partial [Aeoliella sp.]